MIIIYDFNPQDKNKIASLRIKFVLNQLKFVLTNNYIIILIWTYVRCHAIQEMMRC